MRSFFLQAVAQEPAVCHIQRNFFRSAAQRSQSIQMLNENHFEQHNWIYARATIVSTVQRLYHIVDLAEIDSSIYLNDLQAPDFRCPQFQTRLAPFFHFLAFLFTHDHYIMDNRKSPALTGLFRHSEGLLNNPKRKSQTLSRNGKGLLFLTHQGCG